MGLKVKRVIAPIKKKMKVRIKPRAAPAVSSQDVRDAAVSEFIKEAQWVQGIRFLHHEEQRRIFAGMDHDRWSLYIRRLREVISIEDAGVKICACPQCGANCGAKFRGPATQIMCHNCTFGTHRGKRLDPEQTSTTERQNERKKRQDVGEAHADVAKQAVQNVARRGYLRARRHKPNKARGR